MKRFIILINPKKDSYTLHFHKSFVKADELHKLFYITIKAFIKGDMKESMTTINGTKTLQKDVWKDLRAPSKVQRVYQGDIETSIQFINAWNVL